MFYAIVRYVILTAVRDRLFVGLLAAMLLAALISYSMSATALVEEHAMRLAFLSGSLRLITVLGMVIFTCFHVRRTFDLREVESMLARPISRSRFILAYWTGLAVITCGVVFLVGGIVLGASTPASPIGGAVLLNRVLFWSGSLLLENLIVVAIALFGSLILSSAVSSVLFTTAFYVLARMMAFFVMTAESVLTRFEFPTLRRILHGVGVFMPRMDFFTKSEWLVYGKDIAEGLQYSAFQAALYLPLLLVASMYDFSRRQF
jgi:ABC-type transport system involved in multi-copper enzyme maturation permease subunit